MYTHWVRMFFKVAFVFNLCVISFFNLQLKNKSFPNHMRKKSHMYQKRVQEVVYLNFETCMWTDGLAVFVVYFCKCVICHFYHHDVHIQSF